ncbi:hypothetical protein CKO35_03985 [Ectothiorhodospira shaposhnikovii]|nr:hypothetical protein [Ectothiorhodospira shaposhnikovii]
MLPVLLHILHDRGGGVESHVRELTRVEGFRHWLLKAGKEEWRLLDPRDPGDEGRSVRQGWGNPLTRLSGELGIDACHLHHPVGDPGRLRQALLGSGLPFGVTVHDFYWVCPRIHLVTPEHRYCDAPTDSGLCKACLRREPAIRGHLFWRRYRHATWLSRARFVACPTAYVRDVMARHFPSLSLDVAEHAYRPPFHRPEVARSPAAPLSIAVIGALGVEKGGLRVERLAELSRQRSLPLRWVVIGDTLRHGGPQALMDGYLMVHGSYSLPRLPEILDTYGVSVAAFPGVGPETWSLTLDEAWACGLPALVPAMGALAERVCASGAGWVLSDGNEDEAWLSQAMMLLTEAGREAWHRAAARAAAGLSATPVMPPVTACYDRLLRP